MRKEPVWILGGVSVLMSCALLGAIVAPASVLAALVNLILPVTDVSAAHYDRAFAQARRAPPKGRGELLKAAETAAAEEIRSGPLRPEGWVRLAAARAVADGRPSPRAIAALEQSYRVSLSDRTAGPGRIRLALEAWPQLPQDDKTNVLNEIRTLYATADDPRQSGDRRAVVEAVAHTWEPGGRAAGEAALAAQGWSPAAADPAAAPGGG